MSPENQKPIDALIARWRQNQRYLVEHATNEPPAAEQAHVYGRCADELETLRRDHATWQSVSPIAERLRALSKKWRSEGFDAAQFANELDAALRE